MLRRMMTLSYLVLAFSGLVYADSMPTPTAAAGSGRPCQSDVARLCPNIPPGGGRIIACMRQHHDELSEACKEHLQQRQNRREQRRQNANPGPAPQP